MKNGKLFLAGIVILFLAQEAIGLHLRWVDDETWYLLPAQSLLREGRLRIPVFAGPGREFVPAPLLPVMEAASAKLYGFSAVQARLLTVLFGVGVLLLTYRLGRRLFDERVGLIAAALCAVDNMIFLAGRTVRPEIIVCFFTLLALDLLLKSVQDEKWWPVLLSGCAVGMGVSAHPNAVVAALCGVAMLLWYQGWTSLKKPRIYVFALSCMVALLPLAIFVLVNDAARGFEGLRFLGQLHSGNQVNLFQSLLVSARREFLDRYAAFVVFPYRLHVGILVVAAVVVGLVRRSRATRFLATCVVIYLLFFWAVTKANKSPRYLTLIMPFVAILWADWLVLLWRRWHTAFRERSGRSAVPLTTTAGLVVLVGLVPFVGNLSYLWKYRHSDPRSVCRQIDGLIPRNSTIYGGMAFWINLNHQTVVPYMRMPWKQAITEFRPNIVILDDWVMVKGSYPGEWDELREELHQYVDRHGRLLGEIDNPFYGDLKIYEVNRPSGEALRESSAAKDQEPVL